MLATRLCARRFQEYRPCDSTAVIGGRAAAYASYIFVPCTLLYDVILLEVNERLQTALQDHPSFSKAYGSLFYKGQNKAGDTVTKMGKCGGPILYSVSQVIIGCIAGY